MPRMLTESQRFAHDHNLPCLNGQCSHYGTPHYGCKCYEGSGEEGAAPSPGFEQGHYMGAYAQGGAVHFCSETRAHKPDCEFYSDGGQVEENQEFASHPDLSLDHAIVNHGLLHALTKTGHSRSEDPTRVLVDHRDAARRGRRELQGHSKNLFSQHKDHRIDSDDAHADALGAHLDDLEMNPTKALDVGGALGEQAPAHAAALGAKTATVMNHFRAMKPKSQQFQPIDEVQPPSKEDQANYKRQLAIAQRPQSVIQGMRDGTTSPDDLATLHAIYPKLAQTMQNQAGEALIDAKTNGTEIPYKQKMTLSMMLGQPLDSTMTQGAMMAIIQANGGAKSEQNPEPQKGGKKSGATAATLKAIDKADNMALTPLQKIQTDSK